MSRVHVVIPLFNNWSLCHNLLWNLYRKERENIASILIMDNASTDDEVKYGLEWWKAEWKEKSDPLPVKVITNSENLGFLKSSNIGLKNVFNVVDKLYSDDTVILLSTDVQVNGKFISQICDIINENSDSLVGGILYSSSTGWNEFGGNKVFPYLEGWLLATTVQNWERLDYFDERYAPHIFEDIDLSTKAISLGMELVPLNNPGLFHQGGATITYNEERHKLTEVNKEKFRQKWIG